MMYPYMSLTDETEIVHSHLIEEIGVQKVLVHFERPTDIGFDSARCELPSYNWVLIDGYSKAEIDLFERLLRKHFYLLYKCASSCSQESESKGD